jgi:hypothetical protein
MEQFPIKLKRSLHRKLLSYLTDPPDHRLQHSQNVIFMTYWISYFLIQLSATKALKFLFKKSVSMPPGDFVKKFFAKFGTNLVLKCMFCFQKVSVYAGFRPFPPNVPWHTYILDNRTLLKSYLLQKISPFTLSPL